MSQVKFSHFLRARKQKVYFLDSNVVYHWNGTCISFKLVGNNYSHWFAFSRYTCFCNGTDQKKLQAPICNVSGVSYV
jgi:hypothetical protein